MARSTAINIVNAAMQKAIKQDPTLAPLSDSEIETAIDGLNDMIDDWTNVDMFLSFRQVVDKDDDTFLPTWSLAAVKSNLATVLMDQFGRPPSLSLVAEAKDSLKRLRIRLVKAPMMVMPSNQPMGSGNNNCSNSNRQYYPGQDGTELLTEGGDQLLDEQSFPLKTDNIPTDDKA